MSNSPLVSYTKISPNRGNTVNGKRVYERNHAIDTTSIHCVVGQCSVETLGNIFAPESRQASSNYGVGVDGQIGMYCEEKDRSWCTSSSSNDNRAITIEVASDTTHPYAVNEKAYAALLDLLTDICKRNGKTKVLWFGDKAKTLAYIPKADEMVLTVHRWFANKSCPGEYLYNRHGEIAAEVTRRLSDGGSNGGGVTTTPGTENAATLYRVQVGAFSVKGNADAQLAKVKAAGFDTYMVKVGSLYKIQVGAFSKKENANAMMAKVKAAGFSAFITTQKGDPVAATPTKKSVEEIAREVIQGKWGNGADRKKRLTDAGYNYATVQAMVNKLLA